jgi:hypothetical protein
MPQKKVSKMRQKIQETYEENEYASLKQNQTRARSFAVGTTSGGIIEVSMRGDFSNLWYLLHPVEAVEMIEQLAAAAGLQVALRPKQDFTSWRSWDTTIPGISHWVGAAPWQLSDDDRNYLTEMKEKNIKAIEQSKEEIKSLEGSKKEIESSSEEKNESE